MRMNMYVVFDKVAEESGPIFEAKNHGVAVRNFIQVTSKAVAPNEYSLLCLGIYDHDINKMYPLDPPDEIDTAIVAANEGVYK